MSDQTEPGRRKSDTAAPPVERMLFRINDVARALSLSRRMIERQRSAGRFPKPDVTCGRAPLWKPATIQSWIDNGGIIA
jgi:predicted DNA-binding transcriptional regulator AlpA